MPGGLPKACHSKRRDLGSSARRVGGRRRVHRLMRRWAPGSGTKAQAHWAVHVAGYFSSEPTGLIINPPNARLA